MAHAYTSVTWEGEQVVSGQEKAGLPPPGRGSQKKMDYGKVGQAPRQGTLLLQGLKDKQENPTKRKRMVILFITRTRFQHGAVSLPQRSSPKKP